jgi:molybdopterin-guanine dinucleotide biosynthesis protein A
VALSHYENDLDAVIPRSRRGVEPLLGIYQKNFLPVIMGALDNGCYALHRVFDRGRVCFVDVPQVFEDRHELANINTPEEYRQVERWLLESKLGT